MYRIKSLYDNILGCDTLRAIDSVNYNASQNTCAITTAIGASTQAIKDLINSNTMQDLRDRNVELSGALSNCNQSAAFNASLNSALDRRFPYPIPANVVGFGYSGNAPFYGSPYGVPHGFDGGRCDGRCDGFRREPCCC